MLGIYAKQDIFKYSGVWLPSKSTILERIVFWYFNIFELEFYHSCNLIKS